MGKRRDRLDLCGALWPASSRNPIPVDSRRFPSTRHWGGSARRGRASGAECVRRRIDRSRQESTGVEFARAERSARGQRLRGGSESALGRPGVRGRVREGPRTNGKTKCSETRPMGAGRRQIESVTLCVWQCHLRNVSTLSNRTLLTQIRHNDIIVTSFLTSDIILTEDIHDNNSTNHYEN